MGLLSFFRGLKQMAQAGDNFRYIAQNMGTIYFDLKQTNFGSTLTKEQLLYATALCDMFSYLQSGEMGFEDIRAAVITGLAGYVGHLTYAIPHALAETPDQWSDLVNVTMQIENECFELSTNVRGPEIAQQVVQKKSVIREEIIRTITMGRRSPIYKAVHANISIWVQDPHFQAEVRAFTTD